MDDNEVPTSGYALRGQRCHGSKRAERSTRYNMIAALNKDLICVPFLFEGYTNRETFEQYLIHVLIPKLRPGMTLVLDNASFHKGKRIIELIEAAGCRVLFLPSYSPDLNPIEHHWASIKTAIRANRSRYGSFWDSAVETLHEMCAH